MGLTSRLRNLNKDKLEDAALIRQAARHDPSILHLAELAADGDPIAKQRLRRRMSRYLQGL